MQTVAHAVIAAAGLGSRLGAGKPKCLVDIHGRPIIAYQLELLADVPDVRVVIGFQEELVIETVRQFRSDVLFVRNAAFRTTTTLSSYALGARYLDQPCLFMDADILFERQTFHEFLAACKDSDPLIAVTSAKTSDCVFAHRDGSGFIKRFSRTDPSPFEWANLAWLPAGYCEQGDGAVFERLSNDLPLRSREISSYEVDTIQDLALARNAAAQLHSK